MAEKNFAGCILWLHRVIENEPNSSSHRAMLGRCLSAIPEYRREAVEQFEMAIELDPRNLTAHLHYGELLEELKLPARARSHYLRVLELDANHWGARERLNRLNLTAPRASSGPSLLRRLTGRH
jgi:tetratricopeptide (TPR) repeat protein